MIIIYMYILYCFQNLKSKIPLVQGVLANIHRFSLLWREKDNEFNLRSERGVWRFF